MQEIERLHVKLTEFEQEVLVLREQVQVLVPREESLRRYVCIHMKLSPVVHMQYCRELLHMEILLEKFKKAVSAGLDKLPVRTDTGFVSILLVGSTICYISVTVGGFPLWVHRSFWRGGGALPHSPLPRATRQKSAVGCPSRA